jgi:S1-C subfamily serine protease
MEIEQLSKSQIVLLTLLVSFVTSIATGIVTVSLMDQAPPVVAQTVNRVIERTIEKVTPQAQTGQAAATTVITQEKTVVVKESEQIAQAVDRISPSLVRVYSSSAEDALFLGIGIVIDASGRIVTDSAAIDARAEAVIVLPDSTRIRAFVVDRDAKAGVAYMRTSTTTEAAAGHEPIVWKPASISKDRPVLGTSVVALSGKSVSRISDGLVTALIQDGAEIIIDTNIDVGTILQGSPIIDVSGNVVGVSTGVARTSSKQGFIPATMLLR